MQHYENSKILIIFYTMKNNIKNVFQYENKQYLYAQGGLVFKAHVNLTLRFCCPVNNFVCILRGQVYTWKIKESYEM